MTITPHPSFHRSRRNPSPALVACLSLLAVSGCAPPMLYYEPSYVAREVTKEDMRPLLAQAVRERLDDGAVKELVVETEEGRFQLHPRKEGAQGVPELHQLPLAVLDVVYQALAQKERGAERDLVVPTDRYGLLAISVYHSLEDQLRVVVGRTLPPPVPVSVPREELSARYGIGPLEEGSARWTNLDLYYLDHALSHVAPDERLVIAGVPFVRERGVPGGGRGTRDISARWIRDSGKVHIEVYDHLKAGAIASFCGDPSAPQPPGSLGVLHEIGHAVAHAAAVELMRRANEAVVAFNAKIDRFNATREQLPREAAMALSAEITADRERLAALQAADAREEKASSVLAAYVAARGPLMGPTPYGRTDDDESFAESFALYHLDPAALRRVYPAVHDFFERREHIKALQAALNR